MTTTSIIDLNVLSDFINQYISIDSQEIENPKVALDLLDRCSRIITNRAFEIKQLLKEEKPISFKELKNLLENRKLCSKYFKTISKSYALKISEAETIINQIIDL